eukprot:CAMPEP_0113939196 /NCGR_PEP_ID=MMETSP1339-20121228/5546_1 /TAXON_ID=94617 /ORGANISM="Fibrocapsa japonica" /LENGTH=259 /DNA_ID=CAMNT_0000942629 /DNA_START=83 /DNA_END=862 /DNA_ORIENTATION=- /assembly_acc=CAM_ASM_000762
MEKSSWIFALLLALLGCFGWGVEGFHSADLIFSRSGMAGHDSTRMPRGVRMETKMNYMSQVSVPNAPPLPKRPTGISITEAAGPKVVVEAFLDVECPFSCKMLKRVTSEVLPHYSSTRPGELEFIVHQVPQPWHPQSATMHMALVAVREVSPEATVPMLELLCANQPDFEDEAVLDKSRRQLFEELAELAEQAGADKKAVLQFLLDGKAIQGVKFVTKYHRMRGVHVTPTVYINGLVANNIESSFSVDQWKEALDEFLN